MPTSEYIVGSVVAVSHDGDLLYATKGDYTRMVNVVKVTNARSNGFAEKVPGIKEASGSVECVANADDLKEFTEGEEVALVWTPTGGTAHTFTALVTKVKESFTTDGDFTVSFDWESSGSYT
jgi:hypothetical protein